MQPLTLQLRIVTGTGGFTVAWSFIAMFENLTKSVSYMVCLIWKSQGVVEGNTMVHELLSSLLMNQKRTV